MNLKSIKIVVGLLIVICLGCSKENIVENISVACFFANKPIPDAQPGAIFYDEINLHNLKTKIFDGDTLIELKALRITYPEKLQKFSMKDSSVCKFKYTQIDENLKRKDLKLIGNIKCKAISSDIWKVEVKLEDLEYEGLISRKDANVFKSGKF